MLSTRSAVALVSKGFCNLVVEPEQRGDGGGIPSAEGVARLAMDKPSLDFVSDAFAHCKFTGLNEGGMALMSAAGLAGKRDGGCIDLVSPDDALEFLTACAPLRFWEREMNVDLDATGIA